MLLSVIAAAIREDRQWKKLQSAMLKAMAVSTPAPRNIRLRLRAWARLFSVAYFTVVEVDDIDRDTMFDLNLPNVM